MFRYDYLAYYLRKWRTDANLSPNEASTLLNCDSDQRIYSWESGQTIAPLTELVKLVEIYDIPEHEFISVMLNFQKQEIFKAISANKSLCV